MNRAILGGLLSVIVAAACSAKDSGPAFPDVASFCAGRGKAECTATVVTKCALTVDRCISGRAAACNAALPVGLVYTANQADACLNQAAAVYDDALVTQDEQRVMDGACELVFDGRGDTGASCTRDEGCVQSAGLRCAHAAASIQGTCQVPKVVQGGGSCAPVDAVCAEGFHCGTNAHCDVNGAVGEACTPVLPCAADALCDAAGICKAKAPDGTACTDDSQCLHGICSRARGVSEGLCVSEVTLAPNEPFCVDARGAP